MTTPDPLSPAPAAPQRPRATYVTPVLVALAAFVGGALVGDAARARRAPPAPIVLGPRTPRATEAQDRAAIEAILRARVTAFNAQDLGEMVRHYAPGDTVIFHLIPPQRYDLRSFRDDWPELWSKFDRRPVMAVSDIVVTLGAGDMAYARSIVSITGTKRSGHVVDLDIRVTDVLRAAGDRWLIEHEHWSVPVDPQSGRAFLNVRQPLN
jgi:ketosteroid isomerase-like protein